MLKEEVVAMVPDTQLLVTKWTHEVSDLRSLYTWLLYFSVPKMLQLYQLIRAPGAGQVDSIVHEVSFLAVSQSTEREELREGVQVLPNHS